MPGGLREALTGAQGRSEVIIVVVADIRGFSSFSRHQDSADVAMYIKRVYMKLIDEYFPFANFYKATGDGLLMTIPYNENDLKEKAQRSVDACLRCLNEFPAICQDDPMINFPTPDKIGFGVGRGTACCLVSGEEVLDYSGHLLNLTSRLMDLARPRGVILDGAFGLESLSEETRALFESQHVYVRSVAEDEPRLVFVLANVVDLPEHARRPLSFEHWESLTDRKTLAQWKVAAPSWVVDLPKRPKRPDGIQLALTYPLVKSGKVVRGMETESAFRAFRYVNVANQSRVRVDVDEIVKLAKQRRLTRGMILELKIDYVPE